MTVPCGLLSRCLPNLLLTTRSPMRLHLARRSEGRFYSGLRGEAHAHVRKFLAFLGEVKLLPGSAATPYSLFWSPTVVPLPMAPTASSSAPIPISANAQVLCDAARLVGGTWGKAGIIVFAPNYSMPLLQVSAQGGEPKSVEMQGEHSKGDHRSHFSA